MGSKITGRWLREKQLNNALLLLCVVLYMLILLNLNHFLLLFIIDVIIVLILLLIIASTILFGKEAHRYFFIVSFPSVFATLLFIDFQGHSFGNLKLIVLLVILVFFLIFSLRISVSSSKISSKLFYVSSSIGPLIILLTKTPMSTPIFKTVFLVILGVVFVTSLFIYSNEFSFFLRKMRRQYAPFKSEVASDDINLLDIGEILSFFIFQIALVQYFFGLMLVAATIIFLYIIFAMNNYLRFEIGIDFKPLVQRLSTIFTLLIAGLLVYYWRNIWHFCIECTFTSISLLFLLTSFSVFAYKKSAAFYRVFSERLSDLNLLFVPIFLSIIIYNFGSAYNSRDVIVTSETHLLLQSIMAGLFTLAGIVLTIYIPVAILLIQQSEKIRRGSGYRVLLITSPIILSFSLRCHKLITRAANQFVDGNTTEISDLVCQTNYTLLLLMIVALSIVFLVYKYQETD